MFAGDLYLCLILILVTEILCVELQVTVLQFTFDIEHYMAEAIRQEAEWGQRYIGPYNYDLQILDVSGFAV